MEDGRVEHPGMDALQPQEAGRSSTKEDAIPSETITKEQVEKLIAERDATRHSTLDKEISSQRKQLKELTLTVEAKESELASLTEERKSLEKQIEDLTSDDPAKFNLVTKDKELRERERQLKAEHQTREADWLAKQERIQLAEETLSEIDIWEVSTEYENGDPVKLKELCSIFNATTDEQRRKVAETLWPKKPEAPKEPVPVGQKPYSGVTRGGQEDLSGLSPREKIERGIANKKK